MRLSQVTDKLLSQGYLDSRKLFSYATAVGLSLIHISEPTRH